MSELLPKSKAEYARISNTSEWPAPKEDHARVDLAHDRALGVPDVVPADAMTAAEKAAYFDVRDAARHLAETQRANEAAKAKYMEALARQNAIIAPVK